MEQKAELISFKITMVIKAVMVLKKPDTTAAQQSGGRGEERKTEYWRSDVAFVAAGDEAAEVEQTSKELMVGCFKQLDEKKREKSGLTLEEIQEISFKVIKYRGAKGGSYIPTPSYVSKKAVVNVKN